MKLPCKVCYAEKEDSFSIADQDKGLFKNIALQHKIHVKLYVERMGTSLENYIYKMKEGVCYLAYKVKRS